ncbi:MAG: MoxR family ATPase [Candidatus Nanoarchaeia archaeon]|nr:MoxR family ATPase [Candidatus Nanoarchaeia archaeon]MDD5238892.1 MoxR family ATPase [Candidatus Nanoarchaeia archaeon]
MDHKKKIREVINFVNANFIAEQKRSIFNPGVPLRQILDEKCELDASEAQKFVTITTTLAYLNSIMGNNTLLKGESGTAKTQLCKTIASVLYQLPIEFMDLERIAGTPKTTKEDIYGNINLGKLTKEGKVVPFLYLPFYAPMVIIDEINRYTPFEQNIIRDGVSEGVWKISGIPIEIAKQSVMSAMNPSNYDGVWPLNENLADNFALQLQNPIYNIVSHNKIINNSRKNLKALLGDKEITNQIEKFYEENKEDPEKMQKFIIEKTKDMKKILEERDVPFIANGSIDEIRTEISKQPFGAETKLIEYMLVSEMEHSYKYGENRSEDPKSDETHDMNYVSTMLQRPLKGRFVTDMENIAKAISWYMNEKNVSIDALKTAFVYSTAHRIKPETDLEQEILTERKHDGEPSCYTPMPVEYECAKKVFEKAYEHYNDFKNNDKDTMYALRKGIKILTKDEKGSYADAKKLLDRVDHPIAKRVLDDIAESKLKELGIAGA